MECFDWYLIWGQFEGQGLGAISGPCALGLLTSSFTLAMPRSVKVITYLVGIAVPVVSCSAWCSLAGARSI